MTTARDLYGFSFNGSAGTVSGTNIIASGYGGTGNGFTKFTGPTTSEKTFTLPDANATLARTDAGQTFTGTQTFSGLIAANLGVTVGANQNLTMTSGTGQLIQGYSNSVTGSGSALTVTNTNASVTAANVKGLDLSLVGATNANVNANTITGVNFGNVTAIANNAFNGITFGTGFNNFLTSATLNISAAGALSGITTIGMSSQLTSTLVTGTAPLVVASTTNVLNLNASSLNGATFAAPGAIGGTTASTGAFTTITATTSISPTADDGAALGDLTHTFSDLFLATGAVINYANSNVVLTHSSGILTLGTGTLKITTPTNTATSVVTIDGTQTLNQQNINFSECE